MINKIRENFYSTFNEINSQLESRKKDKVLFKKVLDYIGEDFPSFIDQNTQYAFFVRTIHTPNIEHHFVEDILKEFNIQALFCNYTSGKLVMKNKEKYNLVKMSFLEGFNRNKELICSKKSIVNANKTEGKPLKDIMVNQQESLIDFHTNLFRELGQSHVFVDISDWFDKIRNSNDGYYAKFLALFICHGVLIDNYLLTDESEYNFFMKKVWPSFKFIEEKFGCKPLVFPALPIKEENHDFYLLYNSDIKNILINKYDF